MKSSCQQRLQQCHRIHIVRLTRSSPDSSNGEPQFGLLQCVIIQPSVFWTHHFIVLFLCYRTSSAAFPALCRHLLLPSFVTALLLLLSGYDFRYPAQEEENTINTGNHLTPTESPPFSNSKLENRQTGSGTRMQQENVTQTRTPRKTTKLTPLHNLNWKTDTKKEFKNRSRLVANLTKRHKTEPL